MPSRVAELERSDSTRVIEPGTTRVLNLTADIEGGGAPPTRSVASGGFFSGLWSSITRAIECLFVMTRYELSPPLESIPFSASARNEATNRANLNLLRCLRSFALSRTPPSPRDSHRASHSTAYSFLAVDVTDRSEFFFLPRIAIVDGYWEVVNNAISNCFQMKQRISDRVNFLYF